MDIWFLMDFEKGLWVKQYSIKIEPLHSYFWPLVVLDDRRIVIVIHLARGKQMVEIHDPRTNTFSVVADTSHCDAISVYTGNLLSLEVTDYFDIPLFDSSDVHEINLGLFYLNFLITVCMSCLLATRSSYAKTCPRS
ncbi:hypothetical protein BAE44_0012262 [Dichanthelium oligosanthes]|uniref:F-box associated domain-containing protein n=1 Tax=Dichanthelium oligosanthes TaxID=888268 RepID=A0A1E5VNM7_9POAL|nr:hypothetical protein BAE44_0012262 [Dichanthelium oligosanthes]